MKRVSIVLCLFFPLFASAQFLGSPTRMSLLSKRAIPSPPALFFTENKGQLVDQDESLHPEILFTAHSGATDIFVSAAGIDYQFSRHIYSKQISNRQEPRHEQLLPTGIQTYRFSMRLSGASPKPRVIVEDATPDVQNFYLPQCPDGLINVKSYRKITLKDLYPGIDWVLYSQGTHFKYDFVVHKDADPKQIVMLISGAESGISSDGALLLKTPMGNVKEQSPISFQNGKEVPCSFVRNAAGVISFNLLYDKNKEVTIDPAISWATYFGDADMDGLYSSATDATGNIYVTGLTYGPSNLSTVGAYQSSNGPDIYNFLAKFDASGNRIWCTCFGGFAGITFSTLSTCRLDACGNIYYAGCTSSTTGIATTGAFQTMRGGGNSEGFLAKFTNNGVRVWGTYFGGAGDDQVCGLTLDGHGSLFISGYTRSTSGISSQGAYQTSYAGGFRDAFLAKFDTTGSRLWSTYYGGSGDEYNSYCSTDPLGNVYLCGITESSSGIATSNAHQASFGGNRDAFLAKFSSAGNRLWGTYYGGSGIDDGNTCSTDAFGNIYIGGYTESTSSIATAGSFQPVKAYTWDGFFVKFDSSGTRLWGTYYGDNGSESIEHSLVDAQGEVYVSGYTSSSSGLASNGAFQQTSGGGWDGFVGKMNANGSRIWGSFLGGSGNDGMSSCTLSNSGKLIAVGCVGSTGLATNNAFQPTYGGGVYDGFIWSITDTIRSITTNPNSSSFCTGDTVVIPFIANGSFNSGNAFTVQLSDSNGYFNNPINIGSVSGTTSGTITTVIPAGQSAGNGYRIRVVSTNPIVTGSGYGGSPCAHITILANPVLGPISGPQVICALSSNLYSLSTVSGISSYVWTLPPGWSGTSLTDSILTIAGTLSGAISVVGNASNGCHTQVSTLGVTVNALLTPTITLSNTITTNSPYTVTYFLTLYNIAPPYNISWYNHGTYVATTTTPNWSHIIPPGSHDSVYALIHLMPGAICYMIDSAFSNPNVVYTHSEGMGLTGAPQGFKAYPNPVTDNIMFEGLQTGDEISIKDAAGKLLVYKTVENKSTTLSLKSAPAGIYFASFLSVATNQKWHLKITKR